MAYIGTSPSNGVRRRFVYEATANQTSFSGNDESGITLTYVDSLYLDVYQNGVKLKAGDDYTATTGTTVVLVQGASVNDVVEMISFDVFSVNDSVSASAGGSFAGNVGMGGTLAVTGATTLTGVATFGATAIGKLFTDTTNTGDITLNFTTHQNFLLTFTGNVELQNPTTENVGQSGFIIIIQDGTGGRTLSFEGDFETAGAAGITLSTAANSVDVIPYVVKAANSIQLGAVQLAFS